MSISPIYGAGPHVESMQVTQERSNRTKFMSALKRGDYPVVPAEVAAAAAAFDRLDELEAEEAAGVEVWCRSAVDALAAGRELPTDFRGAVTKAEKDGAAHAATQVAIRTIREELNARMRQIIAGGLDEILAGLAAELETLMEPLPTRAGLVEGLDIEDPAALARASDDQRKAFSDLEDARRRYRVLRSAQAAAIFATSASMHGDLKHCDNHLGLDWRRLLPEGLLEFGDVATQGSIEPGDTLERFIRVALRDDVWVPSIDELRRAWTDLHARPAQRTGVDPVVYQDGQPVRYQDGGALVSGGAQ